MFCSRCGTHLGTVQRQPDARPGMVKVPFDDVRVHPGGAHALTQEDLLDIASNGYWVKEGSEEHKASATPFDPTIIPGSASWVPLDCAWAYSPHPGPPNGDPTGSMKDRFVRLGTLRGRTLQEISSFVGKPPNQSLTLNSGFGHTWISSGLFGHYVIGLNFDPYQVCTQVSGESS